MLNEIIKYGGKGLNNNLLIF